MRVEIVDVGPRDGLQNEDKILSPEVRAQLCDKLAAAGVPRVEAASFVNPMRVPQMASAEKVGEANPDEIVLADTIGVGVPSQVRELVGGISGYGITVGCHFHDTRNTGMANAVAAVESGATVLDAAVGGTGGCPFAPRATGNIPTEDLVYLLHGMGHATGIDLEALIEVAKWMSEQLGKELPGQVYRASNFEPVAG
jgi:hydroxymethylglutaryl-CoA lyase/(R)-citramalyl-CoA lyase